MKTTMGLLSFLVFLFWLSNIVMVGVKSSDPGYAVVAVFGSAPAIDGVVGSQEWLDAESVLFNDTRVFVKQDGRNLYMGFDMSDAPFCDVDYLAVLVDADNDKNTSLQPDDFGIGVFRNGTLLEVDLGGCPHCPVSAWGWVAEIYSTAEQWQVEFNITYPKIHVVAGAEKTVGIAFECILHVKSEQLTWPPEDIGELYYNPSKWGELKSTGYSWIPEFRFHALPLTIILSTLPLVLYYLGSRRKGRNHCDQVEQKKWEITPVAEAF